MENKGCCAGKPADNSCSTEKTGACGEKTGGCGPGGKSQCCPGTIIKGALIGGIVMFAWFTLSWTVLPWHKTGFMASAGEHPIHLAPVYQFILCFAGAALLTKILKKRKEGCCPVAGAMMIGLLVALFGYLPNMIWFSYPANYSLTGMADDIIAITLAGAVIGKCILKAGACTMGQCCKKDKDGGDKIGSCGDKAGSCGDKNASCS